MLSPELAWSSKWTPKFTIFLHNVLATNVAENIWVIHTTTSAFKGHSFQLSTIKFCKESADLILKWNAVDSIGFYGGHFGENTIYLSYHNYKAICVNIKLWIYTMSKFK